MFIGKIILCFRIGPKDVDSTQDALIDIFVRIGNFFKCLESYTEVPPTAAMTDVIVKIMIEVLLILAIATEETILRRSSELMLIKVYKLLLAYFLREKS